MKNTKHIMVAVVSLIGAKSTPGITTYPDFSGRPYDGIQTNEAAIIRTQRMLTTQHEELDRIFLLASSSTIRDAIPEAYAPNSNTLQYLEQRLIAECPMLKDRIEFIPYDENHPDIRQSMLAISEIAGKIRDYAEDYEIRVHADMTGGHRHSSMMMLSLLQLLHFTGIETEEFLYTDFTKKEVCEATSLQNMGLLISGADEFTRFGSVRAIEGYFEKMQKSQFQPSPALRALLEAMKNFSDAIKICSTGTLQKELQNLQKNIQVFHKNPGNNLEEKLFAQLLSTINKEYDKLFHEDARLPLIRWCVDKELYQQAITLCTEWLPTYFVEKKIAYTMDEEVITTCKKNGSSFNGDWANDFINNYAAPKQSKGTIDDLHTTLRKLLRSCNDPEQQDSIIPIKDTIPEFANFCAEYQEAIQSGAKTASDLNENYLSITNFLKILYKENRKNPKYSKTYEEFLHTLSIKKIPSRIATLSAENFEKSFPLPKSESAPPRSRWEIILNRYKNLEEAGTLLTQYEKHIMYNFLENYFNIKDTRNKINHANAASKVPIETIATLIRNIVDDLEKLEK